jgi:hypothetical protein
VFENRIADFIGGVLALLLGIIYLIEAFRLPLWTPGGNPGGGFLPVLLGIALIGLALLYLMKTFKEGSKNIQKTKPLDYTIFVKPFFVILSLIIYLFLLPFLGFLLNSFIMIFFLLWILDPSSARRMKGLKACIVSSLVVAVFWLVFIQILQLQLPPWPTFG